MILQEPLSKEFLVQFLLIPTVKSESNHTTYSMSGIVCEILIIANCKFVVSTQKALYKFHAKKFTSTRINLNMYKAWKCEHDLASALFFFKTSRLQYLQPVNRLPSPN